VGDSATVMGVCSCSLEFRSILPQRLAPGVVTTGMSEMVVVSVISVVGVVDVISVCFGDREWVECGLWLFFLFLYILLQ
jgi:hypothetical protein